MIRHIVTLTSLSSAVNVYAYKVYNHDINDNSPSNFAHSIPDPRFARSTKELACVDNNFDNEEVIYREYDRAPGAGSVVGAFVNQKHRREGTIGCCPDNENGRPYGPGKICCGDKIREEVEGQFCCVYDDRIYFEEDRWRCDALYTGPPEGSEENFWVKKDFWMEMKW